MKVTNTSFDVQRITAKDGTVYEIEPGATETVDIDHDNINLQAKVNARLVSFPGSDAEDEKKPAANRRTPTPAGGEGQTAA